VKSDNTLTITTSSGDALVAGNKSFALTTQADFSGEQHVFAQGTDITAKLAGGSLAGVLAVRDQTIPSLRSDLDTLAAGLATALNAAHHQGTDLAGVAGGDLFSPPPAGGVDAAAGFSVLITDPSKVAASSDGSPGSNGNLTRLLAVQKQAVAAG
jgi:flagellar hook-associated protein 1 FlgK